MTLTKGQCVLHFPYSMETEDIEEIKKKGDDGGGRVERKTGRNPQTEKFSGLVFCCPVVFWIHSISDIPDMVSAKPGLYPANDIL